MEEWGVLDFFAKQRGGKGCGDEVQKMQAREEGERSVQRRGEEDEAMSIYTRNGETKEGKGSEAEGTEWSVKSIL